MNFTQNKLLKAVEWIWFLGFCLVAVFFTAEVIEKFDSKDTSFKQYEEPISKHPTITICLLPSIESGIENYEYNTDFKIEHDSSHLVIKNN